MNAGMESHPELQHNTVTRTFYHEHRC